jgi:hypothetical protein
MRERKYREIYDQVEYPGLSGNHLLALCSKVHRSTDNTKRFVDSFLGHVTMIFQLNLLYSIEWRSDCEWSVGKYIDGGVAYFKRLTRYLRY